MGEGFLGIDLGTSAVKTLVVDSEGQVRGSGSAEYPVLHPHVGWAEQDPDSWWVATVSAVDQALGWAGSGLTIRSIGLSGQMHGVSFLGEHDRALYPAVIWADQRSARQAKEITEAVGAERLIDIAGSPIAAGFMAATLLWMREEKSSIWWRTKRVLSPKDELRRRMTGVVATEPGDASATLLFDARWRSWSPRLLDAMEIPAVLLPSVRQSSAIGGELLPDAASALGLAAGTPVVMGTGDAPSGLLGAGIVDQETLLLSLSTGAQVMAPSETFSPDPLGRIHTFCSALEPGPGRPGWYHMGATLVAGMAMRWLRDDVLRLPAAGGYERMTSWAEQSLVGAKGLLFLPYLVGERTPHLDPNARGAFLGLTAQHNSGDLVRAVMEGVTLACNDAYAALQSVGVAPSRIVMAGGGARSPFWRQMVADVFGLPVYALATSDQAAVGACLLAGAGVGAWDALEAAHGWARHGDPAEPDRLRHDRYQELAELFRTAYAPVIDISHRLGQWAEAGSVPRVVPRAIRKRN